MKLLAKSIPIKKTAADEFYEEWQSETDWDEATLCRMSDLVDLIPIWKKNDNFSIVKDQLKEVLEFELKLWWGEEAILDINFETETVIAKHETGYVKLLLINGKNLCSKQWAPNSKEKK